MDLRNDPLYAEAIFFLDDYEVVKEMLFVEFQAVLDGVVGVPEFSRKIYKACYVSIWDSLVVHAVVLFEIPFSKHGHVAESWNLPLRFLASEAVPGPDLGHGNILLMTRSSCEDPDYQQDMWEPGKNELRVLTAIRDAVKRNRLGLYRENRDPGSHNRVLYQRQPTSERARNTAYLDEDYQERLIKNVESTLKYKYEEQIRELSLQHEEVVRQLESQNQRLSDQLRNAGKDNQQQVEIIARKFKAKLERDLAHLRAELSGQLELKEMELSYCQESEQQLQEEIERLEKANIHERTEAVQDHLVEMMDSGIEMIVTQSGIGSYSLKLEQVESYLSNPPGFWAKRCGVSEAQYLAWYQHYKDPICQAGRAAGCRCKESVKRTERPDDFIQGHSDMCPAHQLRKANDFY